MDKEDSFRRETPLLVEKDIISELDVKKGSSLFLGKYSLTEVILVLGKRSFFREAKKRKLWPLEYNLDSSAYPLQRLQIFYKVNELENLIVDLKIREGVFRLKSQLLPDRSFPEHKSLILEWLTLQNPLQRFSPKRSALPGQMYPGLGLGKKVVDIFAYLARLTRKDSVMAFPAYFHNAVLFSRYFYFLNPEKQGEVLAITKSFPKVPLKQLAWIVYFNCLRWEDNQVYEWKAEEQFYPLSKTLKEYFDSKAYKEKVKQNQKRSHFWIDWQCYERKMQEAAERIS